jgi:hypothetical protein
MPSLIMSSSRSSSRRTEELASLGEKTLQKLLLADNSITQLSGIDELSSLVLVDVSENELSSLQGLESHPLLCDVFASSNRIDGDLDEQVTPPCQSWTPRPATHGAQYSCQERNAPPTWMQLPPCSHTRPRAVCLPALRGCG